MTSSWFFLSTLNYDARSTTHQILQPVYNVIEHEYHFLEVTFHVLPENISRRSVSDVNDLSSGFVMLSVARGAGPAEERNRGRASIFSLILDVFPDLQG